MKQFFLAALLSFLVILNGGERYVVKDAESVAVVKARFVFLDSEYRPIATIPVAHVRLIKWARLI